MLQFGWKGILAVGSQEILRSHTEHQTQMRFIGRVATCAPFKQQRTGQNTGFMLGFFGGWVGAFPGGLGLEVLCVLILGQTRGLVGFFSCSVGLGTAVTAVREVWGRGRGGGRPCTNPDSWKSLRRECRPSTENAFLTREYLAT